MRVGASVEKQVSALRFGRNDKQEGLSFIIVGLWLGFASLRSVVNGEMRGFLGCASE